jgi:hypothetical protein
MIRTQIQVTEEQGQALHERAAQENVSVAELVRRAIDVLIQSDRPSLRERRARALEVAGRFASGRSDISTRHDEALAEAFRSS